IAKPNHSINITGIGIKPITRQMINEIVSIAFGISILGLFNKDSSFVSVGFISFKSIFVFDVRYLFERFPSMKATPKENKIPAIIVGMIGTKISSVVTCKDEIARAVGPPQGNMFITPIDKSANVDKVYRLIPIFL